MNKKCNDQVEQGIALVVKAIRRIPYYNNENRLQISIHRIWNNEARILIFPSDYYRWFIEDDMIDLIAIGKALGYRATMYASNNTPYVKFVISDFE